MKISDKYVIWAVGLLFFSTTQFVAWGQKNSLLDPFFQSGPEVGGRIPTFSVLDHKSRHQTFNRLKGERGLVLLFYRSADW